MKNCIIFCAGEFAGLQQSICEEDLIIAADGGLVHAEGLGLRPDIILGDFDSLGYVPQGAQVHPVEKDDTDSMLAIKKGLEEGRDTFYLYGALDGQRVDHTMANFQALAYLARQGARGYLIGCRQIATVIRNCRLELPPHFADYFSVFCMGKDARGVTIRGAKYELDSATLTSGFPLGVSNRFVGKPVTVSVKDGDLLLIWDAANGTP